MFRYLGVNQVRNIDSLYSGENIEINRNLNTDKKEEPGGSESPGGGVKSMEEKKDDKHSESGSAEHRRSHSSEKRSNHSDRYKREENDHHKSSSSSHHHHKPSSFSRPSSSRQNQQQHRYQRQLQLDKFNRFRRSVSVEPSAYRSQHRSVIQKPGAAPGYGGRKDWGPQNQGRRKKRLEREGGWGHPGGGRKRGGYQGRRGNRRRQNMRNIMNHNDDAMDLEMPPPPTQHFRHNARNNKGFNNNQSLSFNPRPPLLPLPNLHSSSSMMMLPPPPPPPLFDMPPPLPVCDMGGNPCEAVPLSASNNEAVQKEKLEHNRMLAEKREEHSMKEKSLIQDLRLLKSQRTKILKQHDPHNNKIVKENEKLQDEIRKKIEATRSAIQMLTDIIGDHKKHQSPQISRRPHHSPVHECESSDNEDSETQSSESRSSDDSHSSGNSSDESRHQGEFKIPAKPTRGRRWTISRNRNIFVNHRDITTRDRRKIDRTSFIQTAGQAVLKSQEQETLQEKAQKMEAKLHQAEDTDNEDIFPLMSSVNKDNTSSATPARTMEEDIEDIFNLRRPPGKRLEEEKVDEGEKKEEEKEEKSQTPHRKSPTTIIEEVILDGNQDLGGILTKPSDPDSLRKRTSIQITLKKRDKRNRCDEKRETKRDKEEKENKKEEDRNIDEEKTDLEQLKVFWCQACNEDFISDITYLNHLHCTTHAQNAKVEQPWLNLQQDIPSPSSPLPRHKHRVCSGSQMLIPVSAWYCKLCHECFVDIRSAASHLQCPEHWTKLKNYTNENPLWEITLLRARSEAAGFKPVSEENKENATVKPPCEEDNAAHQHNSSTGNEVSETKSPADSNDAKPARNSLSEMFADETVEGGDKKLWVPNRKAFDELSRQQTLESTRPDKKKPSFIGKIPMGKGKIKINVGKGSEAGGNDDPVPPSVDSNLAASVGNILSQLNTIYLVEQENEEIEREREIFREEREIALRVAREKSDEMSLRHGHNSQSSRESSPERSTGSVHAKESNDPSDSESSSRSSTRRHSTSSGASTTSADYVDFDFDYDSREESHPAERQHASSVDSSDEELDVDDELVESDDDEKTKAPDRSPEKESSRLDIDFFSASDAEEERGEKFTDVSSFFKSNEHRNHIDTFLNAADCSRLSHEEDESGLSVRVESIMKQQQGGRGLSESSSSREVERQRLDRQDRNAERNENVDYRRDANSRLGRVGQDVSVEYMSENSESSEEEMRHNEGRDEPVDEGTENTYNEEVAEKFGVSKPESADPIGFQGAIFFNKQREERQVELPFLSEAAPPGDIYQDCEQLKSKLDRVRDLIRADGKYSSFQDAFRDHRERIAMEVRQEIQRQGASHEENVDIEEEVEVEDGSVGEGEDVSTRLMEDECENCEPADLDRGKFTKETLLPHTVDSRVTETPADAMFTRNRTKRTCAKENIRSDEESSDKFEPGLAKRKKMNKYVEEEERKRLEQEWLERIEKERKDNEKRILEEKKRIEDEKLRVMEERMRLRELEVKKLEQVAARNRLLAEEEKQQLSSEIQHPDDPQPVPKRPRRLGNLTSLNRFRFETKISEADCSAEIDDTIDEMYKPKRYPPPAIDFCPSYPTRSEFVNFALRGTSVHPMREPRTLHSDTYFKPIGAADIKLVPGKAFKGLTRLHEDQEFVSDLLPAVYTHHEGMVSPLEMSLQSEESSEKLEEREPVKPSAFKSNLPAQERKTVTIPKNRKKKLAIQQEKIVKHEKEPQRCASRLSAISEFSAVESVRSVDDEERVRSLHSRLSGQVEARGAVSRNRFGMSTPTSICSSPSRQSARLSQFEPIDEPLLEEEHMFIDESAARCRDNSLARVRKAKDVRLQSQGSSQRLSRVNQRRLEGFERDEEMNHSSHVTSIFDDAEPQLPVRYSSSRTSGYNEDQQEDFSELDERVETPLSRVKDQRSREETSAKFAHRQGEVMRSSMESRISRRDSLSTRRILVNHETKPNLNLEETVDPNRQRDSLRSGDMKSSQISRDRSISRVPSDMSLSRSRCNLREMSQTRQTSERIASSTMPNSRDVSQARSKLSREESECRNRSISRSREVSVTGETLQSHKMSQSSREISQTRSSPYSRETHPDRSFSKMPPNSTESSQIKEACLLTPNSREASQSREPSQGRSNPHSRESSVTRYNSSSNASNQSNIEKVSHSKLSKFTSGSKRPSEAPIVSKDVEMDTPEFSKPLQPREKHRARSISTSRSKVNRDSGQNNLKRIPSQSDLSKSTPFYSSDDSSQSNVPFVSRSNLVRSSSQSSLKKLTAVQPKTGQNELEVQKSRDEHSNKFRKSNIGEPPRRPNKFKNISKIVNERKIHKTEKNISGNEQVAQEGMNSTPNVIHKKTAQDSDTVKQKAAAIEDERKRLFARMQQLERQIQNAKQEAQKRELGSSTASNAEESSQDLKRVDKRVVTNAQRKGNTNLSKKQSSEPSHSPSSSGSHDTHSNPTRQNREEATSLADTRQDSVKQHGKNPSEEETKPGIRARDMTNYRSKEMSVDSNAMDLSREINRTKEIPSRASIAKESPSRAINRSKETPSGASIPRETPSRNSVARETPSRDSIPRDTPSRNSVARETPSRDSIARETPSRNSVARETPSKTSIPRETPSRDSIARETPSRNINRTKETISSASTAREISSRASRTREQSSRVKELPLREVRSGTEIRCSPIIEKETHQQLSDQSVALKTELKPEPASLVPTKSEPHEAYTNPGEVYTHPSVKMEEDDEHSSGSRENYPGPVKISQYVSGQVVKQEPQAVSNSSGPSVTPPMFIPGIFINSDEQFVVKSSTIYKKRTVSKKKRIQAKKRKMKENQEEAQDMVGQ